jgi:hypothetical protein
MSDEKKQQVFYTKDIDIATYLKAQGVDLLSTEKDHSRKTVFAFDDGDGSASDRSMDFVNGNDTVSASTLLNSQRIIRSVMHNRSS